MASITGKPLRAYQEVLVRGGLIKARPCEVCNKPIRGDVGSRRGLRSDVRHCSDACKQKAYRLRQKALRLVGENG